MTILPFNGHAVGIILKELVRRAILTIRNERQMFEVAAKPGHGGGMDDMFTSADTKAQKVYVKSLTECFPDIPVVAEEGAAALGTDSRVSFTVDPLDGAKAFVRRQSHGVGTMVALVQDGQVVSAFVGDVNTQEIYGYRPDSTKVHRITEYETSEQLTPGTTPLAGRCVLLRDPPEGYSEHARKLPPSFKSYEGEGGSIGTWMARLWKDEVGAVLLPPGPVNPWDNAPVIGISAVIGLGFYRPTGDGWERYMPTVGSRVVCPSHDLLVMPPGNAPVLSLPA